MVVYTVYNLQRRRYNCTDSDHIIESLTQAHRMNFILECNVIQAMAFRLDKDEVEALSGYY